MRDLLELPDIAGFVASQPGEDLGSLETLLLGSVEAAGDTLRLLAPCDLQAIKACGVTFARSMVERVIEERAAGNPALAAEIRARVAGVIGDSLRDLMPGSAKAAEVKALLQAEGLWSQYLEVGIGPDAEVFTKAPTDGSGRIRGLGRVASDQQMEQPRTRGGAGGQFQGSDRGRDTGQ